MTSVNKKKNILVRFIKFLRLLVALNDYAVISSFHDLFGMYGNADSLVLLKSVNNITVQMQSQY